MCNWKSGCSAKWWRQKKCKEFWEHSTHTRGRGGVPRVCVAMDICTKTFPFRPVLCVHPTTCLTDKLKYETAIWGEVCNLRNVLVVSFSLNSDLAFTNQITVRQGSAPSAMCIDCVTNMIPNTVRFFDLHRVASWYEVTGRHLYAKKGNIYKCEPRNRRKM